MAGIEFQKRPSISEIENPTVRELKISELSWVSIFLIKKYLAKCQVEDSNVTKPENTVDILSQSLGAVGQVNIHCIGDYMVSIECQSKRERKYALTRLLKYSRLNCLVWPSLDPEVYNSSTSVAQDMQSRFFQFYFSKPKDKLLMNKAIKNLSDSDIKKWHLRRIEEQQYEKLMLRSCNNNLMQSKLYAEAKQGCGSDDIRFFMILDDCNEPVFIFYMEVRKKFFLNIGRINRGPLMVNCEEDFRIGYRQFNAINFLNQSFGALGVDILLIAPEIEGNDLFNPLVLEEMGFKRLPLNEWSSSILKLELGQDSLLANCKGKWRNTLKKGLDCIDKTVILDQCDEAKIEEIVDRYDCFKVEKNFSGITNILLANLLRIRTQIDNVFVVEAYSESHFLGLVVVAETGDTATYLIGFSSEKGKKMHANSVCLWLAIQHSLGRGLKRFDLGGIGKLTPVGIKRFKRGLNGLEYSLVGEFILSKWNRLNWIAKAAIRIRSLFILVR